MTVLDRTRLIGRLFLPFSEHFCSVFMALLKAQKLPDNYCGSIFDSVLIFYQKSWKFSIALHLKYFLIKITHFVDKEWELFFHFLCGYSSF